MSTDTLIAELDHILSIVRRYWLMAHGDEERIRWRVRLDQLLDERVRLMSRRDAGEPYFL